MVASGHLSPVAIAVLALLAEQPMHAYRMQQLIKERGVDIVVNARTRSGLHAAIDRLARDHLIRVHAVERDTPYPERTVYALTPTGHDALLTALREGVATPAREFPLFPAAVSFLHLLDPEDARRQLERRTEALEQQLAATDAVITASVDYGVPRLHLLEHEYLKTVTTAELTWIRTVTQAIATGTLTWQAQATLDEEDR
jgi:DNA-binding PadR family transcriptional regulator